MFTMWRLFAICAALVSGVASVQVNDLIVFFTSPNGLALDFTSATQLANSQVGDLTTCGVTVPNLQALRDAMILPGKLDLDLATVRKRLSELAYQHVDPVELNSFYVTLRTGLLLSAADAQNNAMLLAMQHTQTELPLPLYQFLTVVSTSTKQAAMTAIGLALAGADPGTLKSVYTTARSKGMSQQDALNTALSVAVVANLYGAPGRYAKDGKLYTAKDFQQYYPGTWFDEWVAAPEEKRTAADGRDYRASEFSQHFGAGWITQWNGSPIADLRRIAGDGKIYRLSEFVDHYGASWQKLWSQAKEVMDVCAGLTQLQCGAQQKCQWWWSGDPTTSCVVRPRAGEKNATSILV